ncbi:response regulator transcription factor [Aquincola sp. S2]|uniref:Response regulator transcription factor n=1 Tax=Pseudaquabacterium terrae TaxID=2732868 RepID=A0ABX2EMM3_9BURK|nr:response regulator transcription factor [Aquabacterium terrae]NRF69875.1 response regulator transcription factor [Aquabacterium terrae]
MKILLVDDHALFREGLKLVLARLSPDSVTLEAGTLGDALRIAREQADITLVLLDLGLPGTHGIDALSQFRQEREDLPIVVLSAQEDRQTVLDALAGGAMGFVPKTTSMDVLRSALEVVLANGIYVPSIAFGDGRALPVPPTPVACTKLGDLGLTERQVQVFRFIVQGKSNKAIANSLNIAESTIKQHVKPILRALGVTSRVGAILETARRGISLDA